MIVTNEKELASLRASGKILAEALGELCAMAKEGVTAADLDLAAERMIHEAGGERDSLVQVFSMRTHLVRPAGEAGTLTQSRAGSQNCAGAAFARGRLDPDETET